MGPINWLAVILSTLLAIAIGRVWYGPLFGRVAGERDQDTSGRRAIVGTVCLQGLSALMLGHNFARLGADTLAVKPWLYWMQSGGIAFGFIIPALWISYSHRRIGRRDGLVDAGFWMAVYLATGTMFWALR